MYWIIQPIISKSALVTELTYKFAGFERFGFFLIFGEACVRIRGVSVSLFVIHSLKLV